MKYLVNWIPLRIHRESTFVREIPHPTLKCVYQPIFQNLIFSRGFAAFLLHVQTLDKKKKFVRLKFLGLETVRIGCE